jgi:hypothetical protein
MAPMSRRLRWAVSIAAGLSALAVFKSGYPVILLMIAAAIVKASCRREWSLAGMTAASVFLPGIAPSGSPTYAIFAVLMSAIVLAHGWVAMEQALARLTPGSVIGVVAVVGLLAAMLRMGAQIPFVSRFAQPLVAEREKTMQLEAIISWVLESNYRTWGIALEGNANPVDAGTNAVERRTRPPTYQGYLDAYLQSRRNVGLERQSLIVTFGGTKKDGLTLVKTVPGSAAGAALVYR